MNIDEMFVELDRLLVELRSRIPQQILNDKINEILNISKDKISANNLKELERHLDWARRKEPLISGGSPYFQENVELIKNVKDVINEAINILQEHSKQY